MKHKSSNDVKKTENIRYLDINLNELDESDPYFVDQFNLLLEKSHERHKEKQLVNPNYLEYQETDRLEKVTKKKSPKNIDMFKDPSPWKPNNKYGKAFEELKPLKNKLCLSDWDLYRVNNLIKRSYTKEQEIPKDKPFVPTFSKGKYFDSSINTLANTEKIKLSESTLAPLGKSIMNKFINDNNKKMTLKEQREKEEYDKKHSKPVVYYSNWKFNKFSGEYFSLPKIDETYDFIKDKKVKYSNPNPFKRTRIKGEYFNKIDLSSEFDKYAD